VSLDVDLRIQTGPDMSHTVYSGNYTHNVSPMWHRAGCLDVLYESRGAAVPDVLPVLEAALIAMRSEPDAYRAMNPPNGWGSYDGAIAWLDRLVSECRVNPRCTVWSCP